MFRRTVVRGLAGAVAVAATAGVGSARTEGELPNDEVRSDRVHPFSSEDDPIPVSAGSWIEHEIGWVDSEGDDSTKEDVERFLDAVEFTASIDGEPVEDPMSHWGDVIEGDDGRWIVWWNYSTPPKGEGVHTFTTTLRFPDGFEDDGTVREPGAVNSLTGYYEVSGGGRND